MNFRLVRVFDLLGINKREDIDRQFREGLESMAIDTTNSPTSIEGGINILNEIGLCYKASLNKDITVDRELSSKELLLASYIYSIMYGLISVDICPACHLYETIVDGPSGGLATSCKCTNCLTEYYIGLYCCITKEGINS